MASPMDAESLILAEAQEAEGRTLAAHFHLDTEPTVGEIEMVVRALEENPFQFARRYLQIERELKRMRAEWEGWRETLSRFRLWEQV